MGFFGGGGSYSNPADAAMPYYNKIPGQMREQYGPYQQMGMQAGNPYLQQSISMASDPNAFMENILKNYQPSKAYQTRLGESMRAAGNTMAMGGMRGSLADIDMESRLADSLLGEDMQQWLQNILGIQKQGMAGEQSLYGTGFQATSQLADQLAQALAQQGNLAYQGQAEQNARNADRSSGIAKGIGTIGGGLAGYFTGGPAGVIPGAKAGSKFF